jgi:hypothetical protein
MSKATDADARAVVLSATRRYGERVFKVDLKGWRYPALRLAETKGWVFMVEDRASVTQAGRQAVGDYLGVKL